MDQSIEAREEPEVELADAERFAGPFNGSAASLGHCARDEGAITDEVDPLATFFASDTWWQVSDIELDG